MIRPGHLALGAALCLTGCQAKGLGQQQAPGPAPTAAVAPVPEKAPGHGGPVAIAHGGVGTPPERSPIVAPAVRAALDALESGRSALDAAVAGTVVLEDEPALNAGTGANVRLDGISVQMDAAVMDSEGRFGAVAVIERVKNPVRVARDVVDTPHSLLAGDGATAFARARGMPDHDPVTPEARARRAAAVKALFGKDASGLPPGWGSFDWRRHYDHQRAATKAPPETFDTVGVLVRDGQGRFGGGLSTGGTTLTLRGRVGDVPIQGAGLYVGPEGAVACTGNGEDIVRRLVARKVYEAIEAGATPRDAVDFAVAGFPRTVPIGIVALDRHQAYAAANQPMAWALKNRAEERLAPSGAAPAPGPSAEAPPPGASAAPTPGPSGAGPASAPAVAPLDAGPPRANRDVSAPR